VRKLTDSEAADALDLGFDVFQCEVKPEIKVHPDGIPVTEIVRLKAEGGPAKVRAAKESLRLGESDSRRAERESRRRSKPHDSLSDFLQPLSPGPRTKLAAALRRAGISSLDSIAAMSEEELRCIMLPSRVAEPLWERLHREALVAHAEKA
jgi:hypothetical protein